MPMPVIIEEERLDAFAKVRGTKACRKRLLEEMKKKAEEFRQGGSRLRIGVAGSFSSPTEDGEWMEMVRKVFEGEELLYDPLAFSIGCHVGAGAFGMGISKKICET